MIPDKKLIEQRFAKAAATYEEQAGIQNQVADRLLQMLERELGQPPRTVLEVGCCTGLLTAKLVAAYPRMERFTVTDLSPSFQPYIEEKTRCLRGSASFLGGDIEQLELEGSYDLIISSSTFHWIHDLPRLFAKLRSLLTPEGVLAFSIYGAENLKEIRQITGVGLPYQSFSAIRACTGEHFAVCAAEQCSESLWFPTPLAVLQHLRQTGVNALGSKAWTRKELRLFIQEYEQLFSAPEGVQLTYHPMFFIARPRP
ncbi:malonyl-ACP O-methyltransferase BioC [Desulfogranum mediterraneum]|uniref:malonyl-ACP O-methyltransferase BioC n=1 Tax=Desulfogranum mediterraneum TaxID=160661 RepID=UPI00042298F6|nr:malonyl-ACP O-methyltransferase BioC [Desulfogranum mediterraneum]